MLNTPLLVGDGERGALSWDVQLEQIDHDLWAKAIIDVRQSRDGPKHVTRWGNWPVAAVGVVVVVVIASEVGGAVIAVGLAPLAVLAAALLVLTRATRGLLARRLKADPSASQPYVFVADDGGTTYASATTRTTMTWDRFRSVSHQDGVIALALDNDTFYLLPDVALNPRSSPGEAVAVLRTWISSAAAARNSTPR